MPLQYFQGITAKYDPLFVVGYVHVVVGYAHVKDSSHGTDAVVESLRRVCASIRILFPLLSPPPLTPSNEQMPALVVNGRD